MSHIVRFAVQGLAGSNKPYAQSLNRDVNIFFGQNGSGKTSLLKVFHSALSTDISIIGSTPVTDASVTIESISYRKQFTYDIQKTPQKNKGRARASAADVHLLDAEGLLVSHHVRPNEWRITPRLPRAFRGHWQHEYLSTSRLLYASAFRPEYGGFNEDVLDRAFSTELEKHWTSFAATLESKARQIQEQGIAGILAELLSASDSAEPKDSVDWEEAFSRVTAFLKRQKLSSALPSRDKFRAKFQGNTILRNVVQRIDQIEKQIASTMETQTKLQFLIERLFTGRKRLMLSSSSIAVETKDNRNIGLQSLSSGEKHILRILFAVIEAGESTLIIDEPEISLHIDWQRELVRSIREINPKLQLIVATHSPEVMADIDDSKIFELPA